MSDVTVEPNDSLAFEAYKPAIASFEKIFDPAFLAAFEAHLTQFEAELETPAYITGLRSSIEQQVARQVESSFRRLVDVNSKFQSNLQWLHTQAAACRAFIGRIRQNPQDLRSAGCRDWIEALSSTFHLTDSVTREFAAFLTPVEVLVNALLDASTTLPHKEDVSAFQLLEEWDRFKTSGRSYDEYMADVRAQRQEVADALMSQLDDLDSSDTEQVWKWLLAIATAGDLNGIHIDRQKLGKFFIDHGFLTSEPNPPPQVYVSDPELYARRAIAAHAFFFANNGPFEPNFIERNYKHWKTLKGQAVSTQATSLEDTIEWQ